MASQRSGTTRVEKAQATRETLIATARVLFADRGYHETSVDDVVAAAAVTKGALYHHFKDKQELFQAVFMAVEVDLGLQIRAQPLVDDDPWEELRTRCQSFMHMATEPEIRRIVLVDGLAVLGWSTWRQLRGPVRLEAIAAESIERGIIADEPIQTLSALIVGALDALALLVAHDPHPKKVLRDATQSLDRFLTAFRLDSR